MNRTIVAVCSLWVLMVCSNVAGQGQMPASVQRDAMKKLDFWVGQWQGTGWVEFAPGQRRTATVTEMIQSKLDGLVLIVEGTGKDKAPGKEEEAIVHHAVGVITYDERAKVYRFSTHTMEGRHADAELKVIDERTFEWGFQVPVGTVRYTINFTEKGQWHERGDFSQDGKTWRQFHEMTLDRVKP